VNPIVSFPGEGETFHLEAGSLARFKVLSRETEGAFEVFEREVPPHTIGADPHLHRTTIETFYVVEGTACILIGDSEQEFTSGAIVMVPKNTVHAFSNRSDLPLKLLVSYTPGIRHEEYFRELARLKHGPTETYQKDLDALRLLFDSESIHITH
jgi:mannose-6-phosphate isomerase-like protein (cupin superfamily)